MIPIPVFNPMDNMAYPNGNGMISVGAGDKGSKLLLYNESPVNINVDFFNGNISILHAWEARFWTLDGDTRQVEWYINSSLNVSNPPISLVIGELYRADEKLEGSYPMALVRQSSVGNPGGVATTSQSSTVNNLGAAANTSVINVSSAANTASTVTLTNDGLFNVFVTIAGQLVQALKTQETGAVIQLAAVNYLTQVLGNLEIDGTANMLGAVIATNANNKILATSMPAIGLTTGSIPTGVTIPSSQVTGTINAGTVDASGVQPGTFQTGVIEPATQIGIGALPSGVTLSSKAATASVADSANSILAANVAAGSLPSGVLLTSTAASANFLNQGANVQYGQLGKNAIADMVDGGTNGTIYYKTPPDTSGNGTAILQSAGTGKVILQNAVGPVNVLIADGNNGIYVSSGKIGKANSGDFVDFSGTGVYMKGASGGNFIFQAPSGTNQWSRTKESTFTGTGTGTYTHGLGVIPDVIVIQVNILGSATTGYDSLTATSVHVSLGASVGFKGYAIKF